MEKVEIQRPRDYQAETGDLLEMHFNIISFPGLKQIQVARINDKLNSDRHLKVERSLLVGSDLMFHVRIVENPFPLVLAIGGVITVLSGFFIWSSLDKVYKIIEEPGSKLLSVGAIAGSIAAIIGLVMIARGRG